MLGPGERSWSSSPSSRPSSSPTGSWADLRRGVAERDLFILDELALRKVIDAGRYAFLLVNDQPTNRWVLWTTMDLVLATKVRVNRRLATGIDQLKAKVLLDLGDSPHHYDSLVAALSAMASALRVIDRHWTDIGPWPSNRPIDTVGAA